MVAARCSKSSRVGSFASGRSNVSRFVTIGPVSEVHAFLFFSSLATSRAISSPCCTHDRQIIFARFGIGIRAAADAHQRRAAGMFAFDLFLHAAGPIAVELVEAAAERGAMASVVDEDRAELFSGRIAHDQNRQRMVDHAGRHDAESGPASFLEHAAIHGKLGRAETVGELCRLQLLVGRECHVPQQRREFPFVLLHVREVLGRQQLGREDQAGHARQGRSAMRVRRTDREVRARQIDFFLQPRGDGVGHRGRNAERVDRHEHHRRRVARANRQGLGEEMLLGFGRFGRAVAVAAQTDGIARRNVHLRDADLIACGGVGGKRGGDAKGQRRSGE